MIDIDIYCDTCNKLLQVNIKNNNFYIEPCELCMEDAERKAYTDGYNVGYDSGYETATEEPNWSD